MDNTDHIGQRIKSRRLELNMTQDELAKKVGYKSRTSINKIELSRSLPLSKVEKMANALETSPSYLMGWLDTPSDDLVELASKVQPTVDLQIDDYFMELPNVMGIQRTERVKELLDYTHQLNDENIDALIKYAKFLSHDDSLIRKDDADD